MQGFATKYYLCKAECGDFVENRQAVTLHTRKTWQVPLRHNSYQQPESEYANTGKTCPVKGDLSCKKGLQPKEKNEVKHFQAERLKQEK